MSNFKELTRPILTYIAMGGLTIGFFLGKVPTDAYVPIIAMTMIYWFKSRDEEKK